MLFKGIRVLDMSTLLPGPMCSLFLADLGADVIKVEYLSGDLMRGFETSNKDSAYFSSLNRNKKSIALNLKTDNGKKIFLKLAKQSDVIIESFRPGKAESLGLGYECIKRTNPKIIYCSITGYGRKGRYRDKAGHDINYSALSGLLDVLSPKPFVPGLQIADVGCAIIAAFSIASSLFYREKTCKGNFIDISIMDSALALINIHIAQYSKTHNLKSILSGNMPCYNIYETKDKRFVSLGAIESKFWQSFCNATGKQDLLARQFDEVAIGELKTLFKSKTMVQWLNLNKKYDFCCEPVKNIGEVLSDIHLKSTNSLIKLNGVTQVAMPIFFSSFGKLKYQKSPKLGQNTREVLKLIGYKTKEIDNFYKEKIVG